MLPLEIDIAKSDGKATKYPTHFAYYFLGASFGFLFVLYLINSIIHSFIDGCSGGSGALVLKKIVLTDLDAVRTAFNIKTVDPYLIVQYDFTLKKTTTVHVDASAAVQKATWHDLQIEFPISQRSVNNGHKLMIAVMDDNVGLKDGHIGAVDISLDKVGVHLVEADSFSIPELGEEPIPLKAMTTGDTILGYMTLEFEIVCRAPAMARENDPYVIRHMKYDKNGKAIGEKSESDFTPDPYDIREDNTLDSSSEVDDGEGMRLKDEIEDEHEENQKDHEEFMDKEEGRNRKEKGIR